MLKTLKTHITQSERPVNKLEMFGCFWFVYIRLVCACATKLVSLSLWCIYMCVCSRTHLFAREVMCMKGYNALWCARV